MPREQGAPGSWLAGWEARLPRNGDRELSEVPRGWGQAGGGAGGREEGAVRGTGMGQAEELGGGAVRGTRLGAVEGAGRGSRPRARPRVQAEGGCFRAGRESSRGYPGWRAGRGKGAEGELSTVPPDSGGRRREVLRGGEGELGGGGAERELSEVAGEQTR